MIIFIPSASHPITPCYFTITVQNHHEPSTDGCSYVCMNNCALLFRLRVPIGCTTELNHSGHQFLQQLFDKYDDVSPPTLSDFCSVSLFGFLILKQRFVFHRRTKTAPCPRLNSQICFESVLTRPGVMAFTCRCPPLLRDTSPTTATTVSGCKRCSRLGRTLVEREPRLG